MTPRVAQAHSTCGQQVAGSASATSTCGLGYRGALMPDARVIDGRCVAWRGPTVSDVSATRYHSSVADSQLVGSVLCLLSLASGFRMLATQSRVCSLLHSVHGRGWRARCVGEEENARGRKTWLLSHAHTASLSIMIRGIIRHE